MCPNRKSYARGSHRIIPTTSRIRLYSGTNLVNNSGMGKIKGGKSWNLDDFEGGEC